MVRRSAAAALGGFLLVAFASTGQVAAQGAAPFIGGPQAQRQRALPDNPNEGLQPDGCIKACPLDTNPCDPPSYKRADGRCNQKD